jgi:hypothetical protein
VLVLFVEEVVQALGDLSIVVATVETNRWLMSAWPGLRARFT